MISFHFLGNMKFILCFPKSIFLISILLNVLNFQHVFCLLIFFWKKIMFYVLVTLYKKTFPKGTKMGRRNPRYFSLMSHQSFILVQPYIIAFDLKYLFQWSPLRAHTLIFPLMPWGSSQLCAVEPLIGLAFIPVTLCDWKSCGNCIWR
jgi:hypothetical protein